MTKLARGGGRISLLVSDVDGTLVTHDKRLTEANIAAARRLQAAGVKLSLVSSRPPAGFAMLTQPLALTAPIGAFNGGAILDPDLRIIEETRVPADAARDTLETFAKAGIDGWLFTADRWFLTDLSGPLVERERFTTKQEPTVVGSFEPYLDQVGKLVGSSHDHAAVEACELALDKKLIGRASARRSQPYYIDITPWGFDKGEAVQRIAGRLGITLDEVAVIGDMANDIPMFRVAAHRIAMGNGIRELKSMADFVTKDNEHDGFAVAIERSILPRAALAV